MTKSLLIVIVTLFVLTACGSTDNIENHAIFIKPVPIDGPKPVNVIWSWTSNSESQSYDSNSVGWYSHPMADLPESNDEINVELPSMGKMIQFVNTSSDTTATDIIDPDTLNAFSIIIYQASMQWARHLDHTPDPVTFYLDDLDGGAAATGGPRSITFDTDFLKRTIDYFENGSPQERQLAIQQLLAVVTHELGHVLEYNNPNGSVDGCSSGTGCHAPQGSKSVMSYDPAANIHVTEEDIHHIPNATWNENEFDEYKIFKTGIPVSIENWGVWIYHEFDVYGQENTRHDWGHLSITDNIHGKAFIEGTQSTSALPSRSATYSGEDNFLGVDMHHNFLGALLRADANLKYTFDDQNMNLNINNFEAHYDDGDGAQWNYHSFSDWGDFTYDLTCNLDGCSSSYVFTKWYSNDSGDETGYVGGVVNDSINEYIGSFVAEKDGIIVAER